MAFGPVLGNASRVHDPAAYELTVLATQCRDLARVSRYPELQKQLRLLAEDYEAVFAIKLGEELKLGERPVDG